MASFNRTMRRALARGKKPEQVKYAANFDEGRNKIYQRPATQLYKNSVTPGGARSTTIR